MAARITQSTVLLALSGMMAQEPSDTITVRGLPFGSEIRVESDQPARDDIKQLRELARALVGDGDRTVPLEQVRRALARMIEDSGDHGIPVYILTRMQRTLESNVAVVVAAGGDVTNLACTLAIDRTREATFATTIEKPVLQLSLDDARRVALAASVGSLSVTGALTIDMGRADGATYTSRLEQLGILEPGEREEGRGAVLVANERQVTLSSAIVERLDAMRAHLAAPNITGKMQGPDVAGAQGPEGTPVRAQPKGEQRGV